jgi:hypothetical protein
MLGGDAVGELHRFGERGDGDDGAELDPPLASDRGAGQYRELALDLRLGRLGELRIGGDEDGLGPCPVLGLRQ